MSVSGLSKRFFIATSSQQKYVRRLGKKKRKKLSAPKPSSRDGNMLYFVRAQPSSTEAATLSSPDSDDDQTQDRAEPDEYQAHSQAHEALIQPFAFCYEPGVTKKKKK